MVEPRIRTEEWAELLLSGARCPVPGPPPSGSGWEKGAPKIKVHPTMYMKTNDL
jgi:hypothetical protein